MYYSVNAIRNEQNAIVGGISSESDIFKEDGSFRSKGLAYEILCLERFKRSFGFQKIQELMLASLENIVALGLQQVNGTTLLNVLVQNGELSDAEMQTLYDIATSLEGAKDYGTGKLDAEYLKNFEVDNFKNDLRYSILRSHQFQKSFNGLLNDLYSDEIIYAGFVEDIFKDIVSRLENLGYSFCVYTDMTANILQIHRILQENMILDKKICDDAAFLRSLIGKRPVD